MASFLAYHLGTDRQWGCFLCTLTCVTYGAAEVLLLISYLEGYDDDFMGGGGTTLEVIDGICQLTAAFFFTWGMFLFYRGEYPERLKAEGLNRNGGPLDVESLSFTERYFTHSQRLLGSWIFVVACIPYAVVGVCFLVLDSITYFYGWAYLIAGVCGMIIFSAWATLMWPELQMKNSGHGSSYLFDALCCIESLRGPCGNDFVFALWIIIIMLFPTTAYMVEGFYDTPSIAYFLLCVSLVLFLWGVMAYAYGHDGGSNMLFNPVACCCPPIQEESGIEATPSPAGNEEGSHLLPSSNA